MKILRDALKMPAYITGDLQEIFRKMTADMVRTMKATAVLWLWEVTI